MGNPMSEDEARDSINELSTVPQEPDEDAEEFDGGEMDLAKFCEPFAVDDNTVVLVRLPLDGDKELLDAIVEATKKWREKRSQVTFIYLPETVQLEKISEPQMNQLGWFRAPVKNPNQLKKAPRRWEIKKGRLHSS